MFNFVKFLKNASLLTASSLVVFSFASTPCHGGHNSISAC